MIKTFRINYKLQVKNLKSKRILLSSLIKLLKIFQILMNKKRLRRLFNLWFRIIVKLNLIRTSFRWKKLSKSSNFTTSNTMVCISIDATSISAGHGWISQSQSASNVAPRITTLNLNLSRMKVELSSLEDC